MLESAVEIIAKLAESSSNTAVQHANTMLNLTVPVLLLVFAGAMVLAFFALKYSVSRPLNTLQSQLANYGRGDFPNLVRTHSRDEIAMIATDVNRVADCVRDMMGHLKETSTDLDNASQQMNSTAVNFTTNAEQTNRQLDSTVSTLDVMAEHSIQVSRDASEASVAASSTNESAQHGLLGMQQTNRDVDQLAGSMRDTSGVITTLNTEADSIGGVLEVIRGIADQTNLLALNAAI
jgi:methyl-accepting chemotaxis protein